MYKICIVILHYINSNHTIQCVESIIKTVQYENFHIVIVDNGSPNDSGAELQELYKKKENVTVVITKKNLGFAKGNNIGYLYAKNVLNADFIYVINNDTFFEQKMWDKLIIDKYNDFEFDILGPDIITKDRMHQNPLRVVPFTKKELARTIFKWWVMLQYYNTKKNIPAFSNIHILEKYLEKKKEKKYKDNSYQKSQTDVVLHGAAVLFSPKYVKCFDTAFDPVTFMYMEENFLALRCKKNNLKTLYASDIKINHLEKGSTSVEFSSNYSKQIFYYKESIKSGKKLLDKMKNDNMQF